MSAQLEYREQTAVTAQAPAMVSVTNQVGVSGGEQEPAVLSLKLAVSRYDIASIRMRVDKEVLVKFEDPSHALIDYANVPHDDLVYIFRAVDELRQHLSRSKNVSGLDITIQKHIPFETHMGGRGAAAAAVLVALAALWDASIAREELARLAQRVGDGVAEAITGGAVMTHVDATEVLITPVLVQSEVAMVLVPAAAELDESEMFQEVRRLRQAQDAVPDRNTLEFDPELVEAVARGDASQLALMMHNDFQPALVSILPEHNDWLTAGMDEGALAAQTIDRGPSLVFLAAEMSTASDLAERFEQHMEISAVAEYGPVAGAHLI
ncbi:GHMP family kinase ATP-binding protein [Yaniella halotolerans]|uniref:GHMP family kinase ATP-binding protein n=1 Tax=Yaniella halotolerans TaxID=225453 RepID=UPI0003B508F4|nr:hypothetical protein [Yaniella halotolerans]